MKLKLKVLFMVNVFLFFSCDDCKDCKDYTTKSILVQDALGNNLLFGTGARINHEKIKLVSAGGVGQLLTLNETLGTLDFFLEDEIREYRFRFNASHIDTIMFI